MSPLFSRHSKKEQTALPKSSKPSKKALWFSLIAIVLIAAGGGAYLILRPTQTSTSQTETLQTATARQGNLVLLASGTGTMMPIKDSEIGFSSGGKLASIFVSAGDEVEEGELLAQLDDSSEQIKLAEAMQTLLELTSPASIAIAQQDIVQAEKDLYEAQVARNTSTYWYDEAAYQDKYAALVIAIFDLEKAQEAYDKFAGESIDSPNRARAYQNLYSAQKAVETARYYANVYSSKPIQRRIDEVDANLALAEARLVEAQNYLVALTGGDVPENATGDALVELNQAKLNVQEAQDALDATSLYAPFSGTIMEIDAQVGDTVGSGSILRIADISQLIVEFYMDESDWNNVKVGYDAEITFDALQDQTFTGKVIQVLPTLISVQNTSMVQGLLQLDQTYQEIQLPVGVSAAVDVISGRAENAVLVPVEALHELSPGKYAVFVMENGKPTLRMVEVGLQDLTYAEIKSGLEPGEVVTTGIVETNQ